MMTKDKNQEALENEFVKFKDKMEKVRMADEDRITELAHQLSEQAPIEEHFAMGVETIDFEEKGGIMNLSDIHAEESGPLLLPPENFEICRRIEYDVIVWFLLRSEEISGIYSWWKEDELCRSVR